MLEFVTFVKLLGEREKKGKQEKNNTVLLSGMLSCSKGVPGAC